MESDEINQQENNSVGMRKSSDWGERIRNLAFNMYISQDGITLEQISQKLGVPTSTLSTWRHSDNWVEKRRAAHAIVAEGSYEATIANITVRNIEAIKRLQQANDEALKGINDENLEFKDKKQATDALINTSKAMGALMEKEFSGALISQIVTIIKEEVSSIEEQHAVAERLLALHSAWGNSATIIR